jgi:hypothetical protein
MKVVNSKGYAYHGKNMGAMEGTPTDRPRRTVTVTFITDGVPGAFHNPEDMMNWIAQNPYVDTVTMEE